MSLFARARTSYQEKGLLPSIKAVLRYFNSLLHVLWRRFCVIYYQWRGRFDFSIGKTRIALRVRDKHDALELFYVRTTERYMIKEILTELRPNDVFWDVGANLGFYSLLAASVPGVNVIAFEPNPSVTDRLKSNIAFSGKSNVRVLEVALTDTEGAVKFDIVNNGRHGQAHIAFDNDNNTLDVAASTGDRLTMTGAVPPPDVIKIDVEGAEYFVIKGIPKALAGCRIVFCEIHPQIRQYGGSAIALESNLKDLGFNLAKIQERNDNTYHLKASRL